MLHRLVYLSMKNVFALLRLLSVSDRDKEAEILALRHPPHPEPGRNLSPDRLLGRPGRQEPGHGPSGKVVLSGVKMARMNAIMERWILTCRRELLDRTYVWNQAHLLHALREFEQFYNAHRPHQGIANTRPLHALPPPIPELATARLDIRRHDRLGGILHEYQHAA